VHRYKLIIEYDGTDFVGWQSQENGISVQQSIETAIKNLTSETVSLFGAGRTDSGVHARQQVAHFDLSKDISLDTLRDGINQHLRPLPIAVLKVKITDENFHARFSAIMRHYEYNITNRRTPLTISKCYSWGVFKKLDILKMKEASSYFEGKHDFNAFRSINCQSSSSIKTIKSFTLDNKNEDITVKISAKSFLHSQVRIMVGTLVEIGKGKIKSEELKKIIESKDRSRAGPTAPAHGLYLMKVEY